MRLQCLSVNSKNNRPRLGIFSKLIIKPQERRNMRAYIAKFEHILQPLVSISCDCMTCSQ